MSSIRAKVRCSRYYGLELWLWQNLRLGYVLMLESGYGVTIMDIIMIWVVPGIIVIVMKGYGYG